MPGALKGEVGRHLIRLFGPGSATGLADCQLVRHLTNGDRELAEAAMEMILTRHGPMVLNVCRRVLGDHHAAEDAFQATFVVLLHRARVLRMRETESLSPWLHGVAYRTASKARRGQLRRRARERRVALPDAAEDRAATAAELDDLRSLLHAEIHRLPAKYRDPVVLCHLEGRTHDQAAAALCWPVGTVRGRLARARDLLRGRLIRHGMAPLGMIGAALLEHEARADVPTALQRATIAVALRGTPTAGLSSIAFRLLGNALLSRSNLTVATVLTMAVLAGGAALVVGSAPAVAPAHRSAVDSVARGPSEPPPRHRPAYPLPEHARARLGTLEFLAKGPGLGYPDQFGRVLHARDGRFLVTSMGSNVCVWDANTGRLLQIIEDVSGEPALAPDGSNLAVFDADHRLTLWDVPTGRVRRRWHAVPEEVYQALTFSPDGHTLAACTGKDSVVGHTWESITLWDLTRRTEYRRRLRVDASHSTRFTFSADGQALVLLDEVFRQPPAGGFPTLPIREHIRLRHIAVSTGVERRRVELPESLIDPFAFSPDGTLLASHASDATIRVFDVTTGQERVPKLRHDQSPRPGEAPAQATNPWDQTSSLAFSPDGSMLAVGGFRPPSSPGPLAPIHLWDVASGKELRHFPAHPDLVRSLSFAPDGKTLASAGNYEPAIRLWDVSTGREKIPHVGHQSAIWSLAVSPADGTVFTVGIDRTIRRWDPNSGRELGIVARLDLPACTIDFSPDGKALLVGTYRGVSLWNVAERREIRRLTSHDIGNWCSVAYSPDGRTVAAEGRVRDLLSGEVLLTLLGPISGPETNPLNLDIPRVPNPLIGSGPKPKPEPRVLDDCPIAYSPDGKQVITVQHEGIQVWDIASGRSLRWAVRAKLVSSRGSCQKAAFSADRRLVATCGEEAVSDPAKFDRTIHVWDLTSGREVVTLNAPLGSAFNAVAFSPDGRLLASGSRSDDHRRGGVVSVWEVATGRELCRFSGHRESVNAVAFTPDGRSVVSGSDDATALVWEFNAPGNTAGSAPPGPARPARP